LPDKTRTSYCNLKAPESIRRGGEIKEGHSQCGGRRKAAERGSDRRATSPPPKLEKLHGAEWRQLPAGDAVRGSQAVVVLLSLSPLPSRERFLASCVSFLSECRAAGWPDARHLCGDGGGASGRRWKKGETVGHLGWGFGRVPDAAGGS